MNPRKPAKRRHVRRCITLSPVLSSKVDQLVGEEGNASEFISQALEFYFEYLAKPFIPSENE